MAKRWYVFLTLAITAVANAAEVRPHGQIPAEVRIGDRIELDVVDVPSEALDEGTRLIFESLPGAQPLSAQGWYVLPEVAREKTGLRILALPLAAQLKTLPAMRVKDEEGKELFRTQEMPLSITIKSVREGAQKEPADLFPPERLMFPLGAASAIGVGSLIVLALLIWGLWRLSRRGRQTTVSSEPSVSTTEDERALTALNELERQASWKKGNFKPHYFGVSEVLKVYFGMRYGFDAPESTTEELLLSLEALGIDSVVLDQIEGLFQRMDRVKFADITPESQEPIEIISKARELISRTKRPKLTVLSETKLAEIQVRQ